MRNFLNNLDQSDRSRDPVVRLEGATLAPSWRANFVRRGRLLLVLWLGLLLLAACSLTPLSTSTPRRSGVEPTMIPADSTDPDASALITGATDVAEPSPGTTDASEPSTPTRLPTPTPVPLPEVCLRQRFVEDVQACHMAPRYDIELTVDPASARVTGREFITYTNSEEEPVEAVYLRLFPNARGYGGTMVVTDVLRTGEPITPTLEQERTALRLPLSRPLEPGEPITFSLNFTVDVPTVRLPGHALFSYVRGVMSLPTVYPIIPVHDDEGWNTQIVPEHGDEVYTDVAVHKVRVSAPSDLTLIASGACTNPEDGVWMCDAGPMRDFTLVLGENYARAAREVRGVVINSYYYQQHQWGGDRALEVAADAFEIFTDLFGPYPYTELDVVETPNRLGGMEYSGLVVIEDGQYVGGGVEWLTAHEVAHQWWMVVVGNDQIDDPWLDEALTQYSTLLYYEHVYGEERAAAVLQGEFVRSYQSLVRRGRDMPAGLPADAYPPSLYWDVVYDKGPLYFHELRERVGDEVFFEILQTYYQNHRYQIATPDSWLAVVEAVSGDSQRDLFETWIGDDSE